MTSRDKTIVERLHNADRSHRCIQMLSATEPTLLSEAAALITELVETLEVARDILRGHGVQTLRCDFALRKAHSRTLGGPNE